MSKSIWRSSFFKLPQHKQFNYIPRYYDPKTDKELTDEAADEIRLERGAFFKQRNKSRLAGAFTGNHVSNTFERFAFNRQAQFLRILMLVGLLTIGLLTLFEKLSLSVAVPFLLLFAVVFIAKSRSL
ncbi:MAG: hypothetical protein IPM47_06660 [Sphingobacteriales bacterium]|nr:MAG: hypothetical protein IPM47_06660 [Sphingobacteriales bacterium]